MSIHCSLNGLRYSASRDISKDTRPHLVGTRQSACRNSWRSGAEIGSSASTSSAIRQLDSLTESFSNHGDRPKAEGEELPSVRNRSRGRRAKGTSWRGYQARSSCADCTISAVYHLLLVVLLLVCMPETCSGAPLTCPGSLQRSSSASLYTGLTETFTMPIWPSRNNPSAFSLRP
jgi:hypothetical protein